VYADPGPYVVEYRPYMEVLRAADETETLTRLLSTPEYDAFIVPLPTDAPAVNVTLWACVALKVPRDGGYVHVGTTFTVWPFASVQVAVRSAEVAPVLTDIDV